MALSSAVVVLWFATRSGPVPVRPVEETTTSVVVIRPSADLGARRLPIRDPAAARALVHALGIDEHPAVPCPPEYTGYDLSVSVFGADGYARRGVYVFDRSDPAGVPTVISWSTSGCRRGPLRDRAAFDRAVAALDTDAGADAGRPQMSR